MKQKLTAVFMTLIIVITGVCTIGIMNAYAADSGNCGAGLFTPGKNAQYKYDGDTKTLTITGTGATKDYGESIGLYPPWRDYKDEIENIVIGEGIETIGNYSFFNCTAVKSVTLPSSLKKISGALAVANSGAFASCTALENITLPQGLETIGYNAFNNCTSLKSITLPDSLTKLEGSYGVDTYGALGPFTGCEKLETVTYGTGMTSTGVCAFTGSGVKYINFSSSITEISAYSFSNTKIVTIELPESVEKKIGTRAFASCSFLDTATVNNANCSYEGAIGDDPFNGSQQSLLMRGHFKSTTQTYANEKGYRFESIDPCEHTETTPVIDPAPTCTEGGVLTQYCDVCGFAVSETQLPPEGHIYTLSEEVNAVESDGHIYSYYICDVCGDTKTTIEHKEWIEGCYSENVTIAPTCTAGGIAMWRCGIEGCSTLPKTVTLPAGSHQVEEYTVTKEPTCTEKGSKEGWCSACKKLITVEIPATGHTNELYDALDNTAEDGHTYEIFKCSVCSAETVVPTHIEWVDGYYTSTVINPICTVDGFRTDIYTVEGCNEVNRITLPKTGEHNYVETSRAEPKCTSTGTITYYWTVSV